MKAKLILVTGMSGIKIEASLLKFISDFKDFRTKHVERKPELIKFDSEIEATYYELHPLVPKNGQVWKDVILQQSYPVLQNLWNLTFERVRQRIKRIMEDSPKKTILVNLHSCYYHNRTQEYLSLISIEKLSSINPTMIVTFIDDIYEIHHRLTSPGGIYHEESNVTNTQMILRLFRLLDWRAKETMISRFIAKNLGISNYVFAVKHSFDTFSNLIYEDCRKVYLSHPITEVRRLEKMGNLDEAKKIMNEITEISDRLSSNYTTFLPTTIDEYRIKNVPSTDAYSKNYYAILAERWEADLYEKPKDFLYIRSGFEDVNELWKKHEDEITRFDEQINHLLEALSDSISDQVTIRDYTLVEQSDMLVIYRPVFNGNASGGVREEFKYYKSLIKDTSSQILCYIYCPQEDINKYYVRQFEKKLLTNIDEEHTLRCKTSFSSITTEESEQLIKSVNSDLLLLDTFDKVLDNHQIEITIRPEKVPLGGNKIKTFKKQFISELMKSYQSIDMYKADVTYFENESISVEQFFNNIQLHLT